MSSLLITNGTILDPSAAFPREKDLLIRDGRIAAIGHGLGRADETIDATGCWVTPGLIDIHVHFREPGDDRHVDWLASGAGFRRAAFEDLWRRIAGFIASGS